MKKYIGAKYVGIDPIRLGQSGRIIKSDEVIPEIPEWEAKGNTNYKPEYEGFEDKKKYKDFEN